jgi:hypothetical protein
MGKRIFQQQDTHDEEEISSPEPFQPKISETIALTGRDRPLEFHLNRL